MEIIEENNCFTFKSDLTNDLVINLNDKQIKVNKEILISESDYFKAMFDNKWIENNNNCVKLEETLIKPFIIVLKLVYDFHIDYNELKIPEMNESIIIANKYQFNRIEKILSQNLIKKLPSINETNSLTSLSIWDLFEMSKMHELSHLSEECLYYIDVNADQVLKQFDKQFIRPEIILEIISRDTFGVKEIDLFKGVINWIKKTRLTFGFKFEEYSETLLEEIRFLLIPYIELEVHVKPIINELFTQRKYEDVLNDPLNGNTNKTIRVSPEKCFCVQMQKCSRKRCSYPFDVAEPLTNISCIVYDFDLQSIMKINCIQFQIKSYYNNHEWDRDSISYIIEVKDIQTKDTKDKTKWKQVIDYRNYECIGLQELYFDEIITNRVRIISRYDLFIITSITYKYTKSPLNLHNNIVEPLNDITSIIGMKALMKCGLSIKSITDYILKDSVQKSFEDYMNPITESQTIPIMLQSLESQQNEFKTYYYIKFCQPFAIDSFQFDVKLQTNDSQLKYEAVFEVKLLSNGVFNPNNPELDLENWIKVSEDLVKESNTCNVGFDLQTVSVIKICGFQFKTDDKQSRIPLYISRVRVPVNRKSDEWLNGKSLSLYGTNYNVTQMLSCLFRM